MGRKLGSKNLHPKTMEDRFNKFVDKKGPDECWEWTGAHPHVKGYGSMRVNGKHCYAHRLSLELHLGRPITPGLFVLHSCDNPICVNPNHLREGTQQDNMDDMTSRQRHVAVGRKLTIDQVTEIRNRKGQTHKSIADEFGVSRQSINFIVNRKSYIKK